ncbi:MAG TPA: hypothetical protein ACQGQH_03285 [Xylella sp.]
MNVPRSEKRTLAIRANFPCKEISQGLGISATRKRNAQEHAAFKTLHQGIVTGTEDEGFKA